MKKRVSPSKKTVSTTAERSERTEAALELLARRMAEYEARIARLEQLAMAVRAVEGQAVDVGPVTG